MLVVVVTFKIVPTREEVGADFAIEGGFQRGSLETNMIAFFWCRVIFQRHDILTLSYPQAVTIRSTSRFLRGRVDFFLLIFSKI